MDFRLTKEEALFQKMCRQFALNEVEPIAAEIDEQERYPEETVQKLMKYGLMGIQFPKEVGGSGGNYVCYTIAIEEMSRVCATTGAIISAHGTLGAWPIYAFGTPEQKEKWLRPLITAKEGAKLGAFGLTEPNAGTDSAAQQGVDMRMYRVIYDAIEEMEQAMKGMLEPKFKEVVLGHAEVRQVFKITGAGAVAGCYVQDGKIQRNAEVRVVRDGIVFHEGHLNTLKRFKDDVKEVAAAYECGMSIENYNDIKEGDIIECFVMEEVKQ